MLYMEPFLYERLNHKIYWIGFMEILVATKLVFSSPINAYIYAHLNVCTKIQILLNIDIVNISWYRINCNSYLYTEEVYMF